MSTVIYMYILPNRVQSWTTHFQLSIFFRQFDLYTVFNIYGVSFFVLSERKCTDEKVAILI